MKVLLNILAAFLSILLVIVLVITPVISFAANVVSRETAYEILSDEKIKRL